MIPPKVIPRRNKPLSWDSPMLGIIGRSKRPAQADLAKAPFSDRTRTKVCRLQQPHLTRFLPKRSSKTPSHTQGFIAVLMPLPRPHHPPSSTRDKSPQLTFRGLGTFVDAGTVCCAWRTGHPGFNLGQKYLKDTVYSQLETIPRNWAMPQIRLVQQQKSLRCIHQWNHRTACLG